MHDLTIPAEIDPHPTEGASVREIRRALGRNGPLIAGITVFTVLSAVVITLLLPPRYEAEVALRLGGSAKTPASSLLGEEAAPLASLGLGGLGEAEIDTDIGVLRSWQIAAAVVDSLGLHVRLDEPRMARDSLIRVIHATHDAVSGSYVLERRDDGRYSIRAQKLSRPVTLPASVEIGAPFHIGNVTLALAPSSRAASPEQIRLSVRSHRETVEDLREDLEVRRQTGRSKLVEMRYRSSDRLLTAAVPNVAAETFIKYKAQTNKVESRSTVGVLRDQIANYEEQLRAAEDRLRQFREGQQVVSLVDEAEAQVKRLAEFQTQRDEWQVEREALSSLLADIRRSDNSNAPATYRQLATFPSFLANGTVQEILQSLIRLENQRAELSVRRTSESVDVQGIDQRIRELELQLSQMGNSYLQSLDTQIAAADAMLTRFGVQLEAVPERELQFARFEREQRLLVEIYQFLQTRLKEAEIQEAVDLGDVRMVDSARVPEKPVSPKPVINLVLALMTGLVIGTTVAVGRELMIDRPRTRDEIQTAIGAVPILGVIPTVPGRGFLARRGSVRRHSPRGPDIPRGAGSMRSVPTVEAYRLLRARLEILLGSARQSRVVVVTSATSDSAKSLTAVNLAIAYAQQGTRTLLIDADPYRSTSHVLPRDIERKGHGSIVSEREKGMVRTIRVGEEGATLGLIAPGAAVAAPGQIARGPHLIDVLRADYDVIIVESPDLGSLADAAELGALADTMLVVVRAGQVERGALRDTFAQLRQLRIPVGGIVLFEATLEEDSSPWPAETTVLTRIGEGAPMGEG